MNHDGKPGILILHGFAGSVEEVRPLQCFLEQKGYTVECPMLAGHGKTKRELAKTTHEDWITSAEQAYRSLAERCGRVIAVGFSMGGLLAANLWNYGYSGLVTINMPVYYWNPKIILKNLFLDFKQYGMKYRDASTDKAFTSLIEFQRLLSKTKPMLSNLTCKTLIVQTMDDDTVNYKSADYIRKRVASEKTVCLLPYGGHAVFQSKSGPEVCSLIEEFIRTCH